MRNFTGSGRGARRAGMRKSMLFFMAALLLLSAGCAAQDDNALSESILQGVANGPKPSASAETPSTSQVEPSPLPDGGGVKAASWAQKLNGFWVEVNRFAQAEKPLFLYFDEAGRVYVGMDNYDNGQYEGEEPAAAWAMENNAPYLIDHASGDKGRIERDASGTLTITWENTFAWVLNRPQTPLATSILMKSDYYYMSDLAQNEKLAYVTFGEELSDDEAYIMVWLKEAVWVNVDNDELIARYGLAEANFDNDYYIYSGDEFEWQPLFVKPEETIFRIVSYNDDGEVIFGERVDFEPFFEYVEAWESDEDRGPLLVYYYDKGTEGIVSSIREEYFP